MTDGEMAKKLESLKKMRLSAMMLQVGFTGENLSEFIQCQVELDALAERLQAEHGDLVTPQECLEAKESLDKFVALIDQDALSHCRSAAVHQPYTFVVKTSPLEKELASRCNTFIF
jgi:hypothetical protein